MTDDKKVFELIKMGKFENIPSGSWKNKDVVLNAIEVSAEGLKFADDKFHFDREIVLKAVKFHGNCLEHLLNKNFLEDQEIVLEAIKSSDFGVLDNLLGIGNYSDQWDGPADKLLSNKEFIVKATKIDNGCLRYADVSLAYDPDLTLNKINQL